MIDVEVVRYDDRRLNEGLLSVSAGLFFGACGSSIADWPRWSISILFVVRGLFEAYAYRRSLGTQKLRVVGDIVEIGAAEGFSRLDATSWRIRGRRLTVVCRGVRYRLTSPPGSERELAARLQKIIRSPLVHESTLGLRGLSIVGVALGCASIGVGVALGQTVPLVAGALAALTGLVALMRSNTKRRSSQAG